ncbi:ligase-associated DNA damage response endonuclease PdeM [Devosia sp.]|uniref:ligase-associated DNA damage response endonuclease PdeM n=1 Tax=Devosia sp. TaxID=1871048 RepID=UPI003265123D
MLRFAGQIFEPLNSGALFWRAENALLVADLHLEKMSSFARHGQFLPPYDTTLTLKRLALDIVHTGASTVISLGDSFHRDYGPATLTDHDRAQIDGLTERANWFWLSGNHDPAPHLLGGQCLPHLELRGLTLTHEPRRGVTGLMAGHLHPAAHIYINGRAVRRPCFVTDQRLLILPAYGASTGNLNILSPAFAGLLNWSALEVTMLGRDRLYPVSPKRLVRG